MSSAKRTVIEISSDSDPDNPLVMRRKLRRLRPKSQQSDPEHDRSTFSEFLARTLPINLISPDIAQYLYRESNIRLAIAREDRVGLEEIVIGDDCLPTWPGMCWDPDFETLHCVVQNRLLDHGVSQMLDDILRKEIVDKANSKLDEARHLGIDLQDITVGKRLLPCWSSAAENDILADNSDIDLDLGSPHENDFADDEMDCLGTQSTVPETTVIEGLTTPTLSCTSSLSSSGSLLGTPLMSDDLTSSGSDPDSHTAHDDEGFDDVIIMNNFVSPQPYYSIEDDPHVVYDVDVVRPDGYANVDLEFYLVEDDSDIDELPECELGIDGDAFRYHFGDHDVVEVEVQDMDLQCSLDISEDQPSDEELQLGELSPYFEQIDISEMPDMVAASGEERIQPVVELADAASPVREDEDTGVVETADGFEW